MPANVCHRPPCRADSCSSGTAAALRTPRPSTAQPTPPLLRTTPPPAPPPAARTLAHPAPAHSAPPLPRSSTLGCPTCSPLRRRCSPERPAAGPAGRAGRRRHGPPSLPLKEWACPYSPVAGVVLALSVNPFSPMLGTNHPAASTQRPPVVIVSYSTRPSHPFLPATLAESSRAQPSPLPHSLLWQLCAAWPAHMRWPQHTASSRNTTVH